MAAASAITISRSSYDNPAEDKSVNVIPPNSETEEVHEDYLVKVKKENMVQLSDDQEGEK